MYYYNGIHAHVSVVQFKSTLVDEKIKCLNLNLQPECARSPRKSDILAELNNPRGIRQTVSLKHRTQAPASVTSKRAP